MDDWFVVIGIGFAMLIIGIVAGLVKGEEWAREALATLIVTVALWLFILYKFYNLVPDMLRDVVTRVHQGR